jgi:prolyl oligopeptidase
VSAGGSEDASLHIMDVATGDEIGEPISRVPDGGVSWTPDSKTIVFNRRKELTAGMPDTERYLDSIVYALQLGKPASSAKPVFSAALLPELKLRRLDNASLLFQPGSPFVVAIANDTTERDDNLFVLRLADFGSDNAPWVRVASTSDEIADVALRGNDLYLYTHRSRPGSLRGFPSVGTPSTSSFAIPSVPNWSVPPMKVWRWRR